MRVSECVRACVRVNACTCVSVRALVHLRAHACMCACMCVGSVPYSVLPASPTGTWHWGYPSCARACVRAHARVRTCAGRASVRACVRLLPGRLASDRLSSHRDLSDGGGRAGGRADRRTDGPTDRRTDRRTCFYACLRARAYMYACTVRMHAWLACMHGSTCVRGIGWQAVVIDAVLQMCDRHSGHWLGTSHRTRAIGSGLATALRPLARD